MLAPLGGAARRLASADGAGNSGTSTAGGTTEQELLQVRYQHTVLNETQVLDFTHVSLYTRVTLL